MTTLTVEFDNPSIVEHFKEILSVMKGVRIVRTDSRPHSTEADVPNPLTLAAMREAESGKDAGTVQIDSLEHFIASMK